MSAGHIVSMNISSLAQHQASILFQRHIYTLSQRDAAALLQRHINTLFQRTSDRHIVSTPYFYIVTKSECHIVFFIFLFKRNYFQTSFLISIASFLP